MISPRETDVAGVDKSKAVYQLGFEAHKLILELREHGKTPFLLVRIREHIARARKLGVLIADDAFEFPELKPGPGKE